MAVKLNVKYGSIFIWNSNKRERYGYFNDSGTWIAQYVLRGAATVFQVKRL